MHGILWKIISGRRSGRSHGAVGPAPEHGFELPDATCGPELDFKPDRENYIIHGEIDYKNLDSKDVKSLFSQKYCVLADLPIIIYSAKFKKVYKYVRGNVSSANCCVCAFFLLWTHNWNFKIVVLR